MEVRLLTGCQIHPRSGTQWPKILNPVQVVLESSDLLVPVHQAKDGTVLCQMLVLGMFHDFAEDLNKLMNSAPFGL